MALVGLKVEKSVLQIDSKRNQETNYDKVGKQDLGVKK